MLKRKTHKQLNVYIEPELHKLLKMKALERNIKLHEYVVQALIMRIEWEKNHE